MGWKIASGFAITFFVGVLVLLVIAMVWDANRFLNVSNAETPAQLEEACSKYDTSTIKRIPQRCFEYLVPFNVKELQ